MNVEGRPMASLNRAETKVPATVPPPPTSTRRLNFIGALRRQQQQEEQQQQHVVENDILLGVGISTGIGTSEAKGTPIPVAIALRNLFPPSVKRNADDDNNKALRGCRHCIREVLPPVRLQLILQSSALTAAQKQHLYRSSMAVHRRAAETDEEDVVVLYSSLCDRRTAHPCWDHLHERVPFFQQLPPPDLMSENRNLAGSSLTNHWQKHHTAQCRGPEEPTTDHSVETPMWDLLYQHLQVRIVLHPSDQRSHLFSPLDLTTSTSTSTDSHCAILAQAPLHPTLLRRIFPNSGTAPSLSTNKNSSLPSSGSSSSSMSSQQYYHLTTNVPHSLPPNAIFIYYSDASTRIVPQLYHLLLRHDIIHERTNDAIVHSEILEEQKRTKRFDDDIFDTLNDEKTDNHRTHTPITTTTNTLLLLEENNPAIISLSTEETGVGRKREDSHHVHGSNRSSFSDTKNETDDGIETSHDDVLRHANAVITTTMQNDTHVGNGEEENGHLSWTITENDDDDDMDVNVQDLQLQKELLHRILDSERASLELDRRVLRTEMHNLYHYSRQVQELEHELMDLQNESLREFEQWNQLKVRIDIRRYQLLQDLRTIYPIQQLPHPNNDIYTIRGIYLPQDVYSPITTTSHNTTDETISTALGHVCHLVCMISKYCQIPLRYGLICNSSRSAIRQEKDDDDGSTSNKHRPPQELVFFPLFKERSIERESLEKGILLLHRDIDCILRMRDIHDVSSDAHMLAKLHKLFV